MGRPSGGGDKSDGNDEDDNARVGLKIFRPQTSLIAVLLVGLLVLLVAGGVLYLKWARAAVVLAVPASVWICAAISLRTRQRGLLWPLIALSCFHIVAASYALVVFLFYFFFKHMYILMVLNWLWHTKHRDRNMAFFLNSAAAFVTLVMFLLYNVWQTSVALHFQRFCDRSTRRGGSSSSFFSPASSASSMQENSVDNMRMGGVTRVTTIYQGAHFDSITSMPPPTGIAVLPPPPLPSSRSMA